MRTYSIVLKMLSMEEVAVEQEAFVNEGNIQKNCKTRYFVLNSVKRLTQKWRTDIIFLSNKHSVR